EDRTGNAVAGPEQFAVNGPVGVADGHGLRRFAPAAEAGALQTTGVEDVHEQAAGVADVEAGHVGAGDAAVVDGGRLDGVHRRLVAVQVRPLGDVAAGVDEREVGLHAVVDEDAVRGLNTRALHEIEVGPDAGGDDDEIGFEALAVAEGDAFARAVGGDFFDRRAEVESDALLL